MTAPAADPVAAWLAGTADLIAKRDALVPLSAEAADEFVALQDELADRAPVLVAALEAVLALTVEWDQRSAALAGEPPVAAQYQTCRAQTLSECANRIRVAIASALRDAQGGAGQEARDG